jgi:hypothetical protein
LVCGREKFGSLNDGQRKRDSGGGDALQPEERFLPPIYVVSLKFRRGLLKIIALYIGTNCNVNLPVRYPVPLLFRYDASSIISSFADSVQVLVCMETRDGVGAQILRPGISQHCSSSHTLSRIAYHG